MTDDLILEHWPIERLVPYARNARTQSHGVGFGND